MHMADALISPAVGGTMWAVSAGVAAWSAYKLKNEIAERTVPLMAVLGAFVFAAQMLNFTIPLTGSSGHLAGGLLLAVLLGPHAAFLVMCSILAVQALCFGDGGLLALGCNIFNMGFWACFVAHPLIYKPLVGTQPTAGRIIAGSVLGSLVALQLGPFGVVVQTLLSGITELPFRSFVLLMQPIHLAIGLVEGLATAAVVVFVWRARPEIVHLAPSSQPATGALRPLLLALGGAAVLMAAVLSWFASAHPDGLEWSVAKTTGKEEVEGHADAVHGTLAKIQEKTTFLPDYGFAAPAEPAPEPTPAAAPAGAGEKPDAAAEAEPWPAVSAGTSVAGLTGGLLVLLLAGLIGGMVRRFRPKPT